MPCVLPASEGPGGRNLCAELIVSEQTQTLDTVNNTGFSIHVWFPVLEASTVDFGKARRQLHCWSIGRTAPPSINTLSPSSVQLTSVVPVCTAFDACLIPYGLDVIQRGYHVQEVKHHPAAVDSELTKRLAAIVKQKRCCQQHPLCERMQPP